MTMRRYLLYICIIIATTLIACNRKNTGGSNDAVTDPVLRELNEKIAADVKNPALYQQRAEYYMNHDKLNDALADVNKAIEIDPGVPSNFLSLSGVYILMGKPQQALESIDKAISLDEKNVESYLRKARLYMIMKDYEHCAENVEKVFSLDPQNADGYFLKGYVLGEYGDTTKAIDAYRKAVQSNQLQYDALMQLGAIFVKRDPKMAIGYFENALKANPKSMETLYNLGILYQENDRPGEALKSYEEMLKIDPKNRYALYNSGYVNLVYLNDFKKAIGYFTSAYESDSTYADALFNRGYAYELSGDYKQAREDFNKVLKISVNHPKAIEGLNRLDNEGK
jgi:tetratricopeptide (TPR) repeat protein